MLSLSRYAKLIFNIFFWNFGAVGIICCGIVLHSAIFWVVGYSPVFMPFAPAKIAPVLFFVQDSSGVGGVVFHELTPLLNLVLPTFVLLFLSWEVDCLANRIFRSWIWLVRARISASFSDFVSHYPSYTNDSYFMNISRMNLSRSIFVRSSYFPESVWCNY